MLSVSGAPVGRFGWGVTVCDGKRKSKPSKRKAPFTRPQFAAVFSFVNEMHIYGWYFKGGQSMAHGAKVSLTLQLAFGAASDQRLPASYCYASHWHTTVRLRTIFNLVCTLYTSPGAQSCMVASNLFEKCFPETWRTMAQHACTAGEA